ncbi:hypothetical protein HZH66_002208 [Vespula vulgaris]|uniref:Uncharacterized protein n=1 Tax=Vespula vulgaris TaxID=7454 RepID=A0A834KP65_VESVU|nr:hypothetical protein HZH66_002208 [Vespula vulgaris]
MASPSAGADVARHVAPTACGLSGNCKGVSFLSVTTDGDVGSYPGVILKDIPDKTSDKFSGSVLEDYRNRFKLLKMLKEEINSRAKHPLRRESRREIIKEIEV